MLDLAQIPPNVCKQIVDNYFDLDDLSYAAQKTFYNDIAYNGRAIQFTLGRLRRKFNETTTTDMVSIVPKF